MVNSTAPAGESSRSTCRCVLVGACALVSVVLVMRSLVARIRSSTGLTPPFSVATIAHCVSGDR